MNVLFTLIVNSKQLAKIEFLIENGMKVYIEFTRTDWEDFTVGINLIWRTLTVNFRNMQARVILQNTAHDSL